MRPYDPIRDPMTIVSDRDNALALGNKAVPRGVIIDGRTVNADGTQVPAFQNTALLKWAQTWVAPSRAAGGQFGHFSDAIPIMTRGYNAGWVPHPIQRDGQLQPLLQFFPQLRLMDGSDDIFPGDAGIVVSGADHTDSRPVVLTDRAKLVAHHTDNNDPALSTRVYDMWQNDRGLWAGLHTGLRPIAFDDNARGAANWIFVAPARGMGSGDTGTRFFDGISTFGPITPPDPASIDRSNDAAGADVNLPPIPNHRQTFNQLAGLAKTTLAQNWFADPGDPRSGYGAVLANFSLVYRQPRTSVGDRREPVIGFMPDRMNGPFYAGVDGNDPHLMGRTSDDLPIYPVMLSRDYAKFGPGPDNRPSAPLAFREELYPDVAEYANRVRVRLAYDAKASHPHQTAVGLGQIEGRWDWYTTTPFMQPFPVDNPPPFEGGPPPSFPPDQPPPSPPPPSGPPSGPPITGGGDGVVPPIESVVNDDGDGESVPCWVDSNDKYHEWIKRIRAARGGKSDQAGDSRRWKEYRAKRRERRRAEREGQNTVPPEPEVGEVALPPSSLAQEWGLDPRSVDFAPLAVAGDLGALGFRTRIVDPQLVERHAVDVDQKLPPEVIYRLQRSAFSPTVITAFGDPETGIGGQYVAPVALTPTQRHNPTLAIDERPMWLFDRRVDIGLGIPTLSGEVLRGWRIGIDDDTENIVFDYIAVDGAPDTTKKMVVNGVVLGSGGGGGGGVDTVSGTAGRIVVDNTVPATPVVNIDPTYQGQTSITQLGVIAAGTWQATTIAPDRGGTGLSSLTAGKFLQVNAGGDGYDLVDIAGGGQVDAVSGTTGRIVVNSTNPANPVVNIDPNYVGQETITNLGTVAVGTWNATPIGISKGGTGATTESDARIALGLQIGTDVQAHSANLDTLAGNNGSGLTNLNAGALDSGTVPDARLPVVPTGKGGTGLSVLTAGKFLQVNAGANGFDLVDGSGGATSLDGLSDVDITSPSNGQFLRYNGTSSAWENSGAVWADIDGIPQSVEGLSATTFSANTFPLYTSADTVVAKAISTDGQTLVAQSSFAAMRGQLQAVGTIASPSERTGAFTVAENQSYIVDQGNLTEDAVITMGTSVNAGAEVFVSIKPFGAATTYAVSIKADGGATIYAPNSIVVTTQHTIVATDGIGITGFHARFNGSDWIILSWSCC